MNDNEIKEMLKAIERGEEPNADLMKFVAEYRRRKNAVYPMAITPEDVVAISMFYDMTKKRRAKEEKPNG